MDIALLKQANEAFASRIATVTMTNLDSGEQRLFRSTDQTGLTAESNDKVQQAFTTGKSETFEVDGIRHFIEARLPQPKLLIIGAVHITQALAPMALMTDFNVTIIDPRPAFATPERFAEGQTVICDWPEDYLNANPMDAYSAMACFTHEPNIDDEAIAHALRANCFYIGALGGKKSHGKRLARLASHGFEDSDLARIHGPIGIDINSSTPAEIAVSTLAEIISALRQQ